MDHLPDHLIIDILNRLSDSTELARCKLVSKTLNRLACQVRSIHLYCSLDRYTKMRSPATRFKVTPFKRIFNKLISEAQVPIESVSIGVDESVDIPLHYAYDLEGENRDLFLTAAPFSDSWMAKIGDGLKSISIEDFLAQSYGRETNVLVVISYHCRGLVELTLKNACLCVYDIRPMPLLTKLTLEDVTMSDYQYTLMGVLSSNCQSLVELKLKNAYLDFNDMHPMPLLTSLTLKNVTIFSRYLEKLLECLPCLQVLNLIDPCLQVFDYLGDTNPKIHHLNLKELRWTLPDGPGTPHKLFITIYAPNLTKLELKCDNPTRLSIHAPLLSYFHLALQRANLFTVEKLKNLKVLSLVSSELYYVLFTFLGCRIGNLTLDSPTFGPRRHTIKFSLVKVLTIFPNVTSLTLGSEVWSRQMDLSLAGNKMEGLKQITVYLVLRDIDKIKSFIRCVVGICTNLSDMVLFIHRDADLSVAISFVSSCMRQYPKVRLRWGTWKEGTKDLHLE